MNKSIAPSELFDIPCWEWKNIFNGEPHYTFKVCLVYFI